MSTFHLPPFQFENFLLVEVKTSCKLGQECPSAPSAVLTPMTASSLQSASRCSHFHLQNAHFHQNWCNLAQGSFFLFFPSQSMVSTAEHRQEIFCN